MFKGFFKRMFGEKGFTKIVTANAVTVTLPGRSKPFTMARDHKLFPALIEALNARNGEAVYGIVAVVEAVTMYTNGAVQIKNGQVYYKEELLHNVVAERIVQFLAEGVDCNYLIKFLERVMLNPLKSARDELFLFLENGQMPLMTDGRFMAYKWLTDDMKDVHSRTFDNPVGRIIEMPREEVDTNRHRTCSTGFHVCTQHYCKFGTRLVVVAVDPADVVAVPSDYNNAKMRVCKYEVLEEIEAGTYGAQKHPGIVAYKPGEGITADITDDQELTWGENEGYTPMPVDNVTGSAPPQYVRVDEEEDDSDDYEEDDFEEEELDDEGVSANLEDEPVVSISLKPSNFSQKRWDDFKADVRRKKITNDEFMSRYKLSAVKLKDLKALAREENSQ